LLDAFGLPIAACDIARFGRHKVLVVERFDRERYPKWLARLPQENFCQVFGIPPELKYEAQGGPGMAGILDGLRRSDQSELDRRRFLKAQLLFWLLAALDGHAKNFSIRLEAGGRFHLTPLYDVMSAWPVRGNGPKFFDPKKLKLAMAVAGKNRHCLLGEIRRRHWNGAAKRNAPGQDFEPTIAEVLAAVPAAVAKVSAALPADFPARVSDPIIQGLLRQAELLARLPPA
jgi:serine/threonine-protein kinase HipA